MSTEKSGPWIYQFRSTIYSMSMSHFSEIFTFRWDMYKFANGIKMCKLTRRRRHTPHGRQNTTHRPMYRGFPIDLPPPPEEAATESLPIYLDYNATTPIDPQVARAMLPYLCRHWGNPSSSHAYGRAAKRGVDVARAQLARAVGASKDSEILFTSGGSESANHAICGAVELKRQELATARGGSGSSSPLCHISSPAPLSTPVSLRSASTSSAPAQPH